MHMCEKVCVCEHMCKCESMRRCEREGVYANACVFLSYNSCFLSIVKSGLSDFRLIKLLLHQEYEYLRGGGRRMSKTSLGESHSLS